MLQIKNIRKAYTTGDFTQVALNNVSLDLRDNEFVAILGPSGSGKTTLLNIIGGLDRYDEGNLIINGVSTKDYKDRDWDSYRNHSIGFVFQSYNLIPHQNVLSNVELALTISGISKEERTRRAKEALDKVGLTEHIHKKPNQLSGGQMQRVAIARALVNDPSIVLADEPTGALDSETSVQIMALLKEVAQDRLVVMVTHNPELADEYATRIVRLRDGVVISDTNPLAPEEIDSAPPEHRNLGKASMSFGTSLSLSFKNLWTKKGRTLLTAFAGSIGIIGIALILALSTGVNDYINGIQRDAMNAYPITINAETIDMSGIMNSAGLMASEAAEIDENRTKIYANNAIVQMETVMNARITENNLTAFKAYLDDPDSDIRQYVGANGIVYTYDVNFDVLTTDTKDKIIDTSRKTKTSMDDMTEQMMGNEDMERGMNMNPMLTGASIGAQNFSELVPGTGDTLISPVITDSYDLLYGEWPDAADEVVLVLDSKNTVFSTVLFQLGLISDEDYDQLFEDIENEKEPKELTWSYEDFCNKTFRLVPACDYYVANEDGTFKNTRGDMGRQKELYDNGLELKIVGVLRPTEGSETRPIQGAIGYTRALTNYLIEYTDKSEVVIAQEKDPEINVLNGVAFASPEEAAKAYMKSLSVPEKASLFSMMTMTAQSATEEEDEASAQDMAAMAMLNMADDATKAAALDNWLDNEPDQEALKQFYDFYMEDQSYEGNLKNFGKASVNAPYAISIYTNTFEDKEGVAACIEAYNENVEIEEEKITYTDYVALLTSSLTSMVNVVTYVLIAFVAVSLVVSCIMIGIITHISVLERTKEIGILRAIGASKRNISQVFNAETLIIGLCSGLLGVGVSAAMTIPINAILHSLLDSSSINVALPFAAAVILVVISVVITMIGGLLPARKASHKDPVIALRSE